MMAHRDDCRVDPGSSTAGQTAAMVVGMAIPLEQMTLGDLHTPTVGIIPVEERRAASRRIRVGSRTVIASPVFETYWRFAAKRQEVFFARAKRLPAPWTDDPIIAAHRFTNAYRAADRVSQYLIKHVQYAPGEWTAEDVLFRTLLFKVFNRVDTWERLVAAVGEPTWSGYRFEDYRSALDRTMANGDKVYSAAYIVPPPHFGEERKHANHLRLIELMVRDKVADRLVAAPSMEAAFELLASYPSLGRFLAFQFLIDLNYSPLLSFDEMEFVVPGPGAADGIKKCFIDPGGLTSADLIRMMADEQERWFEELGLSFRSLWGRPLQLIDCQNLFCEVDKYARVAHPEIRGVTGRTRIKQVYRPDRTPLSYWFPPRWGLNERIHCGGVPTGGAAVAQTLV